MPWAPPTAAAPAASATLAGDRHQPGVVTAMAASTTRRKASASGWASAVSSTAANVSAGSPRSSATSAPSAMARPSTKG